MPAVGDTSADWIRFFGALVGAVIAAVLGWRAALHLRREDRLAERRAALVGELEECLSATETYFTELSIWRNAGWDKMPVKDHPQAVVFHADLGTMRRHMNESRGRSRAALVRLSSLDGSTSGELIEVVDRVVAANPSGAQSPVFRETLDGFRQEIRRVAEGWRPKARRLWKTA